MRPGYEIVSFFLIKQDSEPYYLLSGWKGSIVPSPLLPDLGEVEHETFLLLLWPSPTGEGSCQLSLDVGMLNLKALPASLQAFQRQVPSHLLQWLRDSVRDPVLFLWLIWIISCTFPLINMIYKYIKSTWIQRESPNPHLVSILNIFR